METAVANLLHHVFYLFLVPLFFNYRPEKMRKHLTQNIKTLRNSFKNGRFSVREATDCALAESVKLKELNAFINVTPELALHRAKLSSYQYSKKTNGPLEGITIALKDNFCTKDIPTTCASKMLENFVPPYNAPFLNVY
ncbi:hypothetical protein DOY81_011646 [Sarcophaga bullata]|nr:hypothetical protein DOY81_011646 [Sarcophaga bullata]